MITDVNPFIYSHPLAPDDIIDRDEETSGCSTAAVGGHYVRLYAPRKYGKTSLLAPRPPRRRAAGGADPDPRRPLRRPLDRRRRDPLRARLRAAAEGEDAQRGSRSSCRARASASRSARSGSAPGSSSTRARDPLPALHALLDLPLRLEESGGFRALIVLDEFQDITKVKDMDALLRSHIQFQGEVASFIFAGSEPGLMRGLFEDRERPLYGQAVPMRLERLDDADIAAVRRRAVP